MNSDIIYDKRVGNIPTERTGWVYLIHATGTNRYKIGRSVNPVARYQTLRNQSPYELKIVDSFWTLDTVTDETHLHSTHLSVRVHGEWFEFSRAIEKIYSLADNPVWTSHTKWLLYNSSLKFLTEAFQKHGFYQHSLLGSGLLSLYDYAKSRADFEIIDQVVHLVIPERLQSRCIEHESLNTPAYIMGILDATQFRLTGYTEENQ